MSAEFLVEQCHNVSGTSCVIIGRVKSGEILEGAVGITPQGKRFTVVKIEINGQQIVRAKERTRANLSVKYLTRADIRIGDIFSF